MLLGLNMTGISVRKKRIGKVEMESWEKWKG